MNVSVIVTAYTIWASKMEFELRCLQMILSKQIYWSTDKKNKFKKHKWSFSHFNSSIIYICIIHFLILEMGILTNLWENMLI